MPDLYAFANCRVFGPKAARRGASRKENGAEALSVLYFLFHRVMIKRKCAFHFQLPPQRGIVIHFADCHKEANVRMLNIRHLKVFQVVCREMNMTKASNELFISQPAISKTISEIEEHYHTKLFERRSKLLILTPDGHRLYEYACAVLSMMEKMDQAMQEDSRTEVIRVGASITTGTSILSDISVAFQQINPRAKIIATVDNTDVIERELVDSKLDIAIVEGEINNRSLTTELMGNTEIVLVVNRLHPLYEKDPVTAEDLRDMDFIVREKGSKTRARFSMELEKLDIRWNPTWSCHNTQAIKNAVDAGLGIGVLSKLSVRKRLLSGRFRALNVFPEPLMLHLHIAYRKSQYMPAALERFKSFVIRQYQIMEQEGYYSHPVE